MPWVLQTHCKYSLSDPTSDVISETYLSAERNPVCDFLLHEQLLCSAQHWRMQLQALQNIDRTSISQILDKLEIYLTPHLQCALPEVLSQCLDKAFPNETVSESILSLKTSIVHTERSASYSVYLLHSQKARPCLLPVLCIRASVTLMPQPGIDLETLYTLGWSLHEISGSSGGDRR